MQTPASLLFLDIDATGQFPADQLAFALGDDKAQTVSSVSDALAALAAKPGARYVVVDLGIHGEDILPVLVTLGKACAGKAPLVVLGNVNDLGFYRALKQLGAQEYFTHPASVSEVRASLVQHEGGTRPAPHAAAQPGSVIAFMSAASGDGASTIALNTAYAIAQETRRQTVLVDLDYQFGMIARQLDLHAQFGIRELFDYPERGVDATLVSKMLLQYGSGLNIIAAPDALRMTPAVRPETVRELIGVLKSQFPYVLLDVPHSWSPWTAEALAQADRIVIVSQLWLRSLTHIARQLGALTDAGISRDKVQIGINRSGARFREAITPQDFERVCLKNISYHFANDIKTVVGAENQGKTVIEAGSSQLERQLREAARALSGDAQPAAAAPRRGLRGLFAKS